MKLLFENWRKFTKEEDTDIDSDGDTDVKDVLAVAQAAAKKVKYGDYDKWDSDPNLDKIEQLLGTELDLKGFKFNLSTDFPGQYHIATNGELMGLERKTGVRAQDVEAILQANGYETDPGHKRLVAIDPRYREEL